MKRIVIHQLILSAIFIAASLGAVAQDEFIEIRPKYRSKADRGHYNLRDLTGKRWGVWKIYNRNKVLISEIEYERGRKHGVYIKYNGVTGKQVVVKNYVHGKLDGPYEKYTALGELLVEGEYLMGKKTGVWTYNYASGTIRKTGSYINNLKEGPWEFYNRKEDLVKTIVYKNGLPPQAPPPAPAKKDSAVATVKKKKVIKKKSAATGGSPATKGSVPATTK